MESLAHKKGKFECNTTETNIFIDNKRIRDILPEKRLIAFIKKMCFFSF